MVDSCSVLKIDEFERYSSFQFDHQKMPVQFIIRQVPPSTTTGALEPLRFTTIPEEAEASILTARSGSIMLAVFGTHPTPRVEHTNIIWVPRSKVLPADST
jgi:hypothetical protein